jgi:hypothetical protein
MSSQAKLEMGAVHTTEDVGKMDAFHVPAVKVYSRHEIKPGSKVVFTSAHTVAPAKFNDDWDGIADPHIELNVIKPETGFYVQLKPSKVQGVHHAFETYIPALMPPEPEPEPYRYNDFDDGCRGCYS